MNTELILLIIQIFLIFLIALFMYSIFHNLFYINIEKRFEQYSLNSYDDRVPLFQKLFDNLWNIIKRISKILQKSDVLKRYGKRFDKYIEYYNLNKKSGIDYISIKFIISISLGLIYLISTFIRIEYNSMVLLLILIISFFILDVYFALDYKSRRKKIETDLLSAIIIMNNAFKSGMNIMQAVSIVESELSGEIQEEFKKINMDIKYGLSLETVFERFYERVKIEDVKYITSSLSLINKTGGNIVRVFNSIEKNFYDKKIIKDEMNALTSSSTFMFKLLIIMPIILFLIIYALNPAFFLPLIITSLGRIILLMIIMLFMLYIIIVKRIMKVNV